MTAQAMLHSKIADGMRPFDMLRDLLPLANLIELTFKAELDATGSQIPQEMKRLARSGPLLWFMDIFSATPLLSGYVWMHNGQLVGNVSLILENGQRGLWSISNVAVHPDFRGHGIALRLMEAALQEAREKGAQLVVLEVRADNAPAQRLYRDLGFQVYDSVYELRLPLHRWAQMEALPCPALRQRRPQDWQGLYNLCKAATPAKVQEVKPIFAGQYRLGLQQRLRSWFDDISGRRDRDWIWEENGEIVAWLQVTGHYMQAAHRLHVIVHPRRRGSVEQQLLAAGLYMLRPFPARSIVSTISISHPEALQAWQQAGFQTVRHLDQMVLELHNSG